MNYVYTSYCIVGKFGELIRLSILQKKMWQINKSANRLLIISTNLDGFSLVNHGRFAKFAKLSCYMVHSCQVCHGSPTTMYVSTT